MLRKIAVVSCLSLALLGLSACGTKDAASDSAFHVSAGVADQYETLAAEVKERGGSKTSGDWTVSYIVEGAEPWFEGQSAHASGHETFRKPKAGETHHIEIIPAETATGRIIPDVPITMEVVDDSGKVVEKQKLNFYYSTFFHYANNFHVPKVGTYTLRATLGVPTFNRHGDQAEGPALAEGATVEFTDVELSAG